MRNDHPTPPTGGPPIVSTFADDPEMAELVEYFLGELDERAGALREAMESGDREIIRRISHQMKGAAGGYGFSPISEEAARVEAAALAEECDINELRERVESLIELFRRATS